MSEYPVVDRRDVTLSPTQGTALQTNSGARASPRTGGTSKSLRNRKAADATAAIEDSLRQTCATVLMELAIDDDNKNAVREAGGITRLISLLEDTSADPAVHLNVLGALTNLALNDDNKSEIRNLHAIPTIVQLIESENSEVQQKVVEVVWNLAGNDENRVAILKAGGVSSLLALLPAMIDGSAGDAIVASTLGALSNLSIHPDSQAAIRDADGIKKVIALVSTSQHALTRERAANCLENLALDSDSRQAIRDLGGINALVDLLSSQSLSWIRAASGALKNCSVCVETRANIAANDGLIVLIELLKHRDEEIVGKVADCLGNFALEEEYRTTIRNRSGIPMLLQLLGEETADEIRLAAAGAILNLAVDNDSKLVIRQFEGTMQGVLVIVMLLNANCSLSLRSVAAMTLTNLASEDTSAQAIADVGGVNALIQCMGEPTDDTLQEKAAGALWNLSRSDGIKTTIRKAGGISFLLSIFEFSSFVPAVENALGTLLSLAETRENRFAISQAGAVGLLIRLLEHETNSVVEKAAGVLWNLAHEETVQHSIRNLGGIKPLIGLLTHSDPHVRFNAVGVFPLLTEQDENVSEAFEFGVLGPLVDLLAKESDVIVLQNAGQALGNIAEDHPDYQQHICHVQGLDRLAEVMSRWTPCEEQERTTEQTSRSQPSQPSTIGSKKVDRNSQQELLAKCCFAVWLICSKNEPNQLAFCEIGGLGILSKLLLPTNDDMLLEMAAGAICVLCDGCSQSKTQFREDHGIMSLIRLLGHSCDAVKLNAAKALCHLAESDDNRRIIRELGGLDKLVKLLCA